MSKPVANMKRKVSGSPPGRLSAAAQPELNRTRRGPNHSTHGVLKKALLRILALAGLLALAGIFSIGALIMEPFIWLQERTGGK